MYIRVKRKKTTIFVETEPTRTILEVKAKLEKLLDGKVRHQMPFRNKGGQSALLPAARQ